MKKVNFKKFQLWSGIDHSQTIDVDVRLDLANLIYRYGDIRGMDLALRIYRSEEEVVLNPEEVEYLDRFISGHCSPQMIEAFQLIKQ